MKKVLSKVPRKFALIFFLYLLLSSENLPRILVEKLEVSGPFPGKIVLNPDKVLGHFSVEKFGVIGSAIKNFEREDIEKSANSKAFSIDFKAIFSGKNAKVRVFSKEILRKMLLDGETELSPDAETEIVGIIVGKLNRPSLRMESEKSREKSSFLKKNYVKSKGGDAEQVSIGTVLRQKVEAGSKNTLQTQVSASTSPNSVIFQGKLKSEKGPAPNKKTKFASFMSKK